MKANVLVITGDGLNCENETLRAFKTAGSLGKVIHINELLEKPEKLLDFNILAIPGGFSFGDEISSGQVLALKIKHGLGDQLNEFIAKGNLIIGICNGFQTLTKLGLLPTPSKDRSISLTHNLNNKFINEWTQIETNESKCIWTKNLDRSFKLPIRHAEGRVVFRGNQEESYQELLNQGQVALTYTHNINGSYKNIAGICDETGRIFGLMPHPEAAINTNQNPYKQNNNQPEVGHYFFKNAVDYIENLQRR